MSELAALHLFEGYGIEPEYMIVDRNTLAVRPIADKLMEQGGAGYDREVVVGEVAWSNGRALRVIEMKSFCSVARTRRLGVVCVLGPAYRQQADLELLFRGRSSFSVTHPNDKRRHAYGDVETGSRELGGSGGSADGFSAGDAANCVANEVDMYYVLHMSVCRLAHAALAGIAGHDPQTLPAGAAEGKRSCTTDGSINISSARSRWSSVSPHAL